MADLPNLTDTFDRVYVINCAHRPDRLEEFKEGIEETKVADVEKIIVYPAIIGDYTGHPAGFGGGNGAWGCLQSHRRIMEDLMHDRDERGDYAWCTALILEDDAFFVEDALERLQLLMRDVPSEWGQIYLGGQHRGKKEKLPDTEHVLKASSVNRTHAYAVQWTKIQEIYQHISYMPDYMGNGYHVDHQLERAHQRGDWDVYAPPKWICGQRAGSSNISGQTTPDLIWN